MPSVNLSRRSKIALAVVGILIVLSLLLVKFTGVYINYLWFGEVGHRNVYSTMFWTRTVLFVVFGVLMAAILGASMIVAYRLRPPFRPMSPEQQNLQHYVVLVEPRRKLILLAVMTLALLAAGASAQGDWATWQLFLHGGSFGQKDAQFGLDISFFAWDYPAYRLLLSFAFTAVILSLLLALGIHYLTGAIRLQTPGPKITLSARRHVTVLVFVFMLLKAAAYWLDRYGLAFNNRSGRFTGPSYTDVHTALPAKTILFWITIVLALGVLASIWLRSALLPGIGFVVLIILSIVLGGIIPAIVQRVSVKPNASDKEAPYIQRNIAATREAYGIQTVDGKGNGSVIYKAYPATSNPAPAAVTDTNTTVDNIRILDPNVVGPTFTNAQKIAYPYGFSNPLNIDRYTVDGVTHDYVVAARQLVPSNLTGSLNNWINQHTVYTHGYGFVAAQADQDVTNSKTSSYTEGDIPPSGPLNIKTPQIYYGQKMQNFSVVGAKDRKREFDGGTSSPNITYTGKGGVSLSSEFTKLAFAINYRDTNFVLNDAVGAPGAKVIFNRDPKARVQKIAPFLTIDGSPYPFVDQQTGHIMWMVDGYTTMANFPYSQRQSLSDLTGTSLRTDQKDTQINYIRNSVKATVDAYDGTVKLYKWGPRDPVLQAWMKVFPHLITSTMPAAVRAHVRYPQDLFNVQRALLAQYHISKAVNSYNGIGKWSVPTDPNASGDQPPFYILAQPPDGSSNAPEFQLTSPMVVNNSPNLAAYVSADSDPGPDYGKLTVLTVPGKSAIDGPSQVATSFKTDSTISKDITLLDQGQSKVIHGNLLTLPVGNSFLYVEPLYVTSSFPTLQRVLVSYGDNLGYGATLKAALADIQQSLPVGSSLSSLGQTTAAAAKGGSSTTPSTGPSTASSSAPPSSAAPSSTSTAVPKTEQQVITALTSAQAQLNAALASKDQVKIAQAQVREQQLVKALLTLQSAAPPPSAKASPTH